jgi:hypothetical protein
MQLAATHDDGVAGEAAQRNAHDRRRNRPRPAGHIQLDPGRQPGGVDDALEPRFRGFTVDARAARQHTVQLRFPSVVKRARYRAPRSRSSPSGVSQ